MATFLAQSVEGFGRRGGVAAGLHFHEGGELAVGVDDSRRSRPDLPAASSHLGEAGRGAMFSPVAAMAPFKCVAAR